MSRTWVKRAYRYRFYPTEGQAAQLSRTFGCVRMVYNQALEARATAWQREQRRVSYTDTSAMLTRWKATEDAMPLHIRRFECARCGLVVDRDHNAALNILAAGRAVAACGDGVRPIRR